MKQQLFDLTGKRALVTGSSQGIGLSLARGLAGAGAEVVLNGRSQDKLDDAQEKLERFELDCIDQLNATEDDSERQVWSRAHIKALKVASLLAVMDHPYVPVVRIEHVAWALTLVRQDIELFQSRKPGGGIGTDDDARERKLLTFMKDYLLKPVPRSYKVPDRMQENSIVPRSFLQMRSATLPAFNNHKLGARRALDDTMRSLIANGYVMEVKSDRLVEHYSFHGVAYRILKLPDMN